MKLSGLPIFLIGLSVALIALSFAFFQHWQPNLLAAEFDNTRRDQLQAEISKAPQVKRRVEDAQKLVEEKAAQWRQVVATRTPPANVNDGGINIGVNAWQLVVDTPRFRNSIQRAVNSQIKRGGVTVVQGPEIPDPDMNATGILASYYNYPAIRFPVVIFDLGQVTVRGRYAQIMANVRSWANMPRYLAVADGLALTGTSPQLTGTYNLTIVGYIRGDEIFPPVPEGASGGGGGQQPGGNQPAGRGRGNLGQ